MDWGAFLVTWVLAPHQAHRFLTGKCVFSFFCGPALVPGIKWLLSERWLMAWGKVNKVPWKKAWMLTFLCFAEKDPDVVENWLAIWRHVSLLHLTLLLAAPGARQAQQFRSPSLLQVSSGKVYFPVAPPVPCDWVPKGTQALCTDSSVKEAELLSSPGTFCVIQAWRRTLDSIYTGSPFQHQPFFHPWGMFTKLLSYPISCCSFPQPENMDQLLNVPFVVLWHPSWTSLVFYGFYC